MRNLYARLSQKQALIYPFLQKSGEFSLSAFSFHRVHGMPVSYISISKNAAHLV